MGGEMTFKQKGREESCEMDDPLPGQNAAKLLGVENWQLFYKNFIRPKIKVGTEWVYKGQNADNCLNSVAALARTMYNRLFLWLVDLCNRTLIDPTMKKVNFIGVLDIAGFEIFEFNTFEQICINFCNEKLQQFFNHHMFVLEQEEYRKEGINWVFMDFGMDLQACIELFEKPMGIFSILEEESMFPKATDKSFTEKLNANHLGKSQCFIKPKPPKRGQKKSGGFKTVSSSYREQLTNLMRTLNATSPHFIRRIVPNETKSPGVIDAALVMHQLTCNGVLEGIRICRKGFPNRIAYEDFKHRYKILNAKACTEIPDEKKAATEVMDSVGMDRDKYRVGKTKVFFKAGVLGELEEIRDDRLGKIISWLQAWIRGRLSRMEFKRLQRQRESLIVVQRNLRKYLRLKSWAWYRLWMKVKPLLNVTRVEDEIAKLEERATKAVAELEEESNIRKKLDERTAMLTQEKADLLVNLEASKGSASEYLEKQAKLAAQKADLEAQIQELSNRLASEEQARLQLIQEKKKGESDGFNLKKDIEDMELNLQKTENEKATKDHQIRNLNDEITHQDELINKANKEKKNYQETNQKNAEELQAVEDKCNHLNKVKVKLEQTLDELEDSLEREKKIRSEVDKTKRKLEGDLKLTQEAVSDLERNRKEFEGAVSRKDKEINAMSMKLEEEQSLMSKTQKQIKECQARVEELEEEVEHERQARAKAEKAKSKCHKELEELGDRLDEAGGATAAQIELNKKRETELAKLRRDLEESNIQHEAALVSLRKKHNDAVAEMSEQVDHLNKIKARIEKEKDMMKRDTDDARSATDGLARDKAAAEKINKQIT